MVKRMNPPLLEFGNGKRVTEPIRAFAELGCSPYKIPLNLSNGIQILPIIPENGEIGNNLINLLKDTANGISGAIYPRSKYNGVSKSFGIKIDILKAEKYTQIVEIKKIIENNSRTRDLDRFVLAIAIQDRTSGCGDYQSLKIHSIHHNVRSQFFTGPNLKKYGSLSQDYKSPFLWNVSLGIIAKLECVPWKLLQPLEGIRGAIGLNTVMQSKDGKIERAGITALQIWNDWGECIGSFHIENKEAVKVRGKIHGISSEEINEILRPALLNLSEIPLRRPNGETDKDSLTIHVSDRYGGEIYDEIVKSITDNGYDSYKIIHISDKSSHFQFNPSQGTPSKKWPWAGSWDFIIPDKKAYFYTAGAWKYYSGPPYAISAYPVFPLEVSIVRGSPTREISEHDLFHIYQLTRLAYYTSDIVRLKTPVTIKLGRRGAQLVQCGLNNLSMPISFLY